MTVDLRGFTLTASIANKSRQITGILVQPAGTRTISADACSECDPPITVTLTNIEHGNIYPS